jgi:hypothetical protein
VSDVVVLVSTLYLDNHLRESHIITEFFYTISISELMIVKHSKVSVYFLFRP